MTAIKDREPVRREREREPERERESLREGEPERRSLSERESLRDREGGGGEFAWASRAGASRVVAQVQECPPDTIVPD